MSKKSSITEKDFVCGWAAATTNIVLTYPIQKISSLQVINNESIRSASKQIIDGYNLRFIYRGILPPLCQKSLSISCMFGFYSNMYNYLAMKNVKHPRFLSGFASGTMECLIMPFERMQSILINQKFNQKYKHTLDILFKLKKEYGYKEYFRGFTIISIRNISGNICFFTLKHKSDNYIKKKVESSYSKKTFYFIHGGIIGAFLSTTFYPLNVLKLEMQKEIGTAYISVLKAIQRVSSDERGIKSFYRGGFLNGIRAFMSWGIINFSFEVYSNLLYG